MLMAIKYNLVIIILTIFILLLVPFTIYSQSPTQREPITQPSLREIEDNSKIGAVHPSERKKSRIYSAPKYQNIDPKNDPLINAELLEKYKKYTEKSSTGITKLYPNFDCEKQKTITVKGDCQLHVVGRSELRFRHGSPFPDLLYNNGSFVSYGFLSLSFIYEIGDIDLDTVDLKTSGVDIIKSFPLKSDFHEVRKVVKELGVGFHYKGIFLSNQAPVKEGSVYLLRTVAFRSNFFWNNVFGRKAYGRKLNPDLSLAKYDRRIDVIVAFKVVEMDSDGSVHLIWRQINRQKSPKLLINQNHDPNDLW